MKNGGIESALLLRILLSVSLLSVSFLVTQGTKSYEIVGGVITKRGARQQ
jgi:hypothetical protein